MLCNTGRREVCETDFSICKFSWNATKRCHHNIVIGRNCQSVNKMSRKTDKCMFNSRENWETVGRGSSVNGIIGHARAGGLRLQTANPVTLWQMWNAAPPKAKRSFNEKPTAMLSEQCTQPRNLKPKKGSDRCLTTSIWGKIKQLGERVGSSWVSHFPPSYSSPPLPLHKYFVSNLYLFLQPLFLSL